MRTLATALSLSLALSIGVGSVASAHAEAIVEHRGVAVEEATARRPVFTAEQRRVAQLVNDTRSAHGKARLTLSRTLTRKAQQWAEYLARANRLAHSDLTAGVPANWRALGENVAFARSIVAAHQNLMRSSPHRRNILGRWNQIGTGYATHSGQVFIVQVFMRT